MLFPDTGHQLPTWTVAGSQIADINIVQKPHGRAISNPLPRNGASVSSSSLPRRLVISWPGANEGLEAHLPLSEAPAPLPVIPQPQPFVDPAILSVGRRPSVGSQTVSNRPAISHVVALQEAPSTPAKHINASVAAKPKSRQASASTKGSQNSAAILTAPFSGLDISVGGGDFDETDDAPQTEEKVKVMSLNVTRTGKPMDGPVVDGAKKKTKQRTRKRKDVVAELIDGPDSPRANNGLYRGKGWRQTPILRDSADTSPKTIAGGHSTRDGSTMKRNRRQQRAMELEARNNGWATEDATDIQDLPEFDFEGNLSKFDKRSVFDQIRSDDHTAEEDRLVSFNRLPQARPGTYGGKNLHPTENVLDSPQRNSRRGSYVTSDSDISFDFEGRTTRREYSRSSMMRQPFRQNSGTIDDTGSVVGVSRSSRPVPRPVYGGSSSIPTTASPVPARLTPPESPSIGQTPHFRLVSSNRVCPTITPGGMTAIEEVAEVEFGISAEIMTNDAGRGIAEAALSALNPGGRRLARENIRLNSRPVALFLVGNHRTGARALAAARHLRNRGVKTLACILGADRPGVEVDREVRRQAETLAKQGTAVRGWADARAYLARLEAHAQPELVVEALLAPARAYDGLGPDDRRAVADMVAWINRGAAAGRVVVSVDTPSGLNGSTGDAVPLPPADDAVAVAAPPLDPPLEVAAKHVVCVGAPRIGLLRALQKAHGGGAANANPRAWQIWVVDIGVNRAWKQCGIAGGAEGVRFGSEWVCQVRFVDGSEDAGRV